MGLKIRDYVFVNGIVFRNVFVIACVALWTPVSVAGLILDPSGGTVIYSGVGLDDQTFHLSTTGFQGKFYGQNLTSASIAENGNINFGVPADSSFFPRPFSDTTVSSRIAPFWDDFQFVSGAANQIVNHSDPGSYLAITWKDVWLFNDFTTNPNQARTTQVVWFERDMSINGFGFKKDDIAFGYSGFRDGNIDATIGVNIRTTSLTTFTGIPGGNDGAISSTLGQSNLIPWGDGEFLLFRPTSNGLSYAGTRESITAVPEPSSIFLALGSIALAFAKWRRQVFTRLLIRKPN